MLPAQALRCSTDPGRQSAYGNTCSSNDKQGLKLTAHKQDEVDLGDDVLDRAQGGGRVQHHTSLHAQVFDLQQGQPPQSENALQHGKALS